MTDSVILSILFSTVEAIVATLTGLIGGFATFRLQRMDAKLDFLKDYVLHKEIRGTKTLNQKLREKAVFCLLFNVYRTLPLLPYAG
jgi:hypothetical protein